MEHIEATLTIGFLAISILLLLIAGAIGSIASAIENGLKDIKTEIRELTFSKVLEAIKENLVNINYHLGHINEAIREWRQRQKHDI